MIVSELIEFLKKQPQDIEVTYENRTGSRILTEDDIYIKKGCMQVQMDGLITSVHICYLKII